MLQEEVDGVRKEKERLTAAPEMQIFINVNEISIYDLEFLSFIFSMSQLYRSVVTL